MVLKEISPHKHKEAEWEEVPDEELWEDGELNKAQAKHKMAYRVLDVGDWKLMRKKNG